MSDDTKQWSKLLQAIDKGLVIPIIGRDLLRIKVDGREQLLYEHIATRLAAQLEVECEPGASIDQVVAAYLNASRQNARDDIDLEAILKQLRDAEGKLPVPEPLRQLATIEPLRLYLSTTIDPLLAHALGSPADHVFGYLPPFPVVDIPRDYARSRHRVVFHLFGRITGTPNDSALIDEETLEFIWKLHEESLSTRLANLFYELQTKRLLLIGNAHPDWLARFFFRLARRNRLSSGNETREFVADGAVSGDTPLREFLKNFSPQTKSFGVANPIEFVDQLAAKWDAFPDKTTPATSEAAAIPAAKAPAVFVSYARQDSEAVERLQGGLNGAGLVVWYDRDRLKSGDHWRAVIEENIAACAVFVPVLSANTNNRDEGVFIREWNLALERLCHMDKKTAHFIHPVIVDDTAESAVSFSGFREFNYARAAGGQPPDDFIRTLTDAVRKRRAKAGPP